MKMNLHFINQATPILLKNCGAGGYLFRLMTGLGLHGCGDPLQELQAVPGVWGCGETVLPWIVVHKGRSIP